MSGRGCPITRAFMLQMRVRHSRGDRSVQGEVFIRLWGSALLGRGGVLIVLAEGQAKGRRPADSAPIFRECDLGGVPGLRT